jgi:tetratricopeptide (TPR) repeat protein
MIHPIRETPMRPIRLRTAALASALLAALAASPAAAQNDQRPVNLKVLPRDLSRDSVIQIMRGWSASLGVSCRYCHAPRAEGSDELNFASDARPEKDKARAMVTMTRAINGEHLPRVPERRGVGVGCVTCHRGLPVPTTLDRVLIAAADSGGGAAAVARYRQLRQEESLLGRWDFSEATVSDVARRLNAQGKRADAIALLEMSGEFHPNSAGVDFQLGELYRAAGERDKAIARYRMALQKNPQNQQARRRLHELTGTTPPLMRSPRR